MSAHDVGHPRVCLPRSGSPRPRAPRRARPRGRTAVAHGGENPPPGYGGTEAQEVLHVKLRAEDGVAHPRTFEDPLGLGVPAHDATGLSGAAPLAESLTILPTPDPAGSLYKRAFHLRLVRVVSRHEEHAPGTVQHPRQGLGAFQVSDDRLYVKRGQTGGASSVRTIARARTPRRTSSSRTRRRPVRWPP